MQDRPGGSGAVSAPSASQWRSLFGGDAYLSVETRQEDQNRPLASCPAVTLVVSLSPERSQVVRSAQRLHQRKMSRSASYAEPIAERQRIWRKCRLPVLSWPLSLFLRSPLRQSRPLPTSGSASTHSGLALGKRRRGLIHDEQLRLKHQRPRDRDGSPGRACGYSRAACRRRAIVRASAFRLRGRSASPSIDRTYRR